MRLCPGRGRPATPMLTSRSTRNRPHSPTSMSSRCRRRPLPKGEPDTGCPIGGTFVLACRTSHCQRMGVRQTRPTNRSLYRFEKPRDELRFSAERESNVVRLTSTAREIQSPKDLGLTRQSKWLGGPTAVRRIATFYSFINREGAGKRLAGHAELTHAVDGESSTVASVLNLEIRNPIDNGGDLRENMARELHDQVMQTMYAMKVELENFRSSQYGREAVLREVDLLERLTLEVLRNVRQLVRDLRVDPDLQEGLIAGLRNHLIPRFERISGQKVDLRVSRSWPSRLNEQADVNVYRIIQEALNNTWRHAQGRSVAVALELIGPRAVVWVNDIGNPLAELPRPRVQGDGILGMRERAAILGGRMTMNANPAGTMLRASFPLVNLLP